VETLDKAFTDFAKNAKKQAEGLDFGNAKDLGEIEELLKQINKLQKENEKLQDKLNKKKEEDNKLTEEQIKKKTKIQIQNAKIRKQVKDEIKQAEAVEKLQVRQIKNIDDLVERNKQLRIARGQLDLDTQADEIAEINKELDENNAIIAENSDKLKQQRLNVGNYTDSIKAAIDSNEVFGEVLGKVGAVQSTLNLILKQFTKQTEDQADAQKDANKQLTRGQKAARGFGKALKASGIGLIVGAVGALGAAFTQTREGALEAQKAQAVFQATLNVTLKRIAAVGRALISFFKNIPDQFQIFGLEIKKAFTFDDDEIKEIDRQIAKLTRATEKRSAKAGKELADAFAEGFGDTIVEQVDRQVKLVEARFAFQDERRRIERNIAALQKQEETAAARADDATKSFKEREAAARVAFVATEDRIAAQKVLAQTELDFAEEALKIQLADQKIRVSNVRDIIKNSRLRMKVGEEELSQQQAALLALEELNKEERLLTIENNKRIAELKQDRLERDLDILIDGFDNQKTINERVINDDRRTFDERSRLIDETRRLSDESFNEQVKTIEKFGVSREQVNELIQISDAKVLNERIRLMGVSEIIEGRVLEILRDRKTALQDLEDLEVQRFELNKAETELTDDLIAQQEALLMLEKARAELNLLLAKPLEDLTQDELNERLKAIEEAEEKISDIEENLGEQRTQNRIKQLQDEIRVRIQAGENGSKKVLELQQQLNDELLKLSQERADKAAEQQKKEIEERLKREEEAAQKEVELRQQAIAALENFLQVRSERRLEQIDNEIDAVQRRQDELRKAAETGSKDAVDALAFEQKREAELQRERQKEIERQKRIELGLTALKTYTAKVDAGDEQPLTNTFRDLLALQAFVQALPAFYEGTENVGDSLGAPHLNTSKDQYMIRADGSERILTGAQNALFGNISNNEAAHIMDAYNNGLLVSKSDANPVLIGASGGATAEKMDELISEIKGLPRKMPVSDMRFNELSKMMLEIRKSENKIERRHNEIDGIWR
jgi:hypothetical protein